MPKRPVERPGEDEEPSLKEMMRQARELIGDDDGTNAAIDVTAAHVDDNTSDSGILRRKLKKLLHGEAEATAE